MEGGITLVNLNQTTNTLNITRLILTRYKSIPYTFESMFVTQITENRGVFIYRGYVKNS